MSFTTVEYNPCSSRFECHCPEGYLDTILVFPAVLMEGDYLPNLYILGVDETPFIFHGHYDAKSDALQFVLYGPKGHFYKLSVQMGPSENDPHYLWKVKRHGETNGRGFYDHEVVRVPRASCVASDVGLLGWNEVFRHPTWRGTLPEAFAMLRLKIRIEKGSFARPPARSWLEDDRSAENCAKSMDEVEERDDNNDGQSNDGVSLGYLRTSLKDAPRSHINSRESVADVSIPRKEENKSPKIGQACEDEEPRKNWDKLVDSSPEMKGTVVIDRNLEVTQATMENVPQEKCTKFRESMNILGCSDSLVGKRADRPHVLKITDQHDQSVEDSKLEKQSSSPKNPSIVASGKRDEAILEPETDEVPFSGASIKQTTDQNITAMNDCVELMRSTKLFIEETKPSSQTSNLREPTNLITINHSQDIKELKRCVLDFLPNPPTPSPKKTSATDEDKENTRINEEGSVFSGKSEAINDHSDANASYDLKPSGVKLCVERSEDRKSKKSPTKERTGSLKPGKVSVQSTKLFVTDPCSTDRGEMRGTTKRKSLMKHCRKSKN